MTSYSCLEWRLQTDGILGNQLKSHRTNLGDLIVARAVKFTMVCFKGKLAWLGCLIFVLVSGAKGDDENENFLSVLRNKYDGLPPRGKFIAGAAVGFVGSRLAIGSAVGALKVAGVAFIT